jgi:hypothetical protein
MSFSQQLRTLAPKIRALKDAELWQQELKGLMLGALHEFLIASDGGYSDGMPQKDTPDQLAKMAAHLADPSAAAPDSTFMAGIEGVYVLVHAS